MSKTYTEALYERLKDICNGEVVFIREYTEEDVLVDLYIFTKEKYQEPVIIAIQTFNTYLIKHDIEVDPDNDFDSEIPAMPEFTNNLPKPPGIYKVVLTSLSLH